MTLQRQILGRILLTAWQAARIQEGGTIDIPRDQFRQHIRRAPRIGDLVWVQEPYTEYHPRGWFAHYGVLVGPHGRARNRLDPRVDMVRSTVTHESGKYLPRARSCVTLEVMGWDGTAGAVRFLVHMKQIDAFVAPQGKA